MLSDTSFVRIVLVDNKDKHWLLYEKNDLYATEENPVFLGAAFETNLLDSIIPRTIIATISNAVLNVICIKNNKTKPHRININMVSDSLFLEKNISLVKRINDTLSKYKKAWRADTTFLSKMRYQQRKKMFNDTLPNLRGWDYYAYGYYSPLNDTTPLASNTIVKEFDWRDRHGAMNSDSDYYNLDGSGWIPKRRYGQGANECWAFSVLYSMEAMVNLYFNRQLNDELSVQNIISCVEGVTYGQGFSSDKALDFAEDNGIINDACFPYTSSSLPPCENQCSSPTERVHISGYINYITGENTIKEKIITKGVLVASLKKWKHAMCMVGFGVVKAGDRILYGYNNTITGHDLYVEQDSPDIGKPYYIFKQSYATYGYDQTPFCNIIINANGNDFMTCRYINTPITSLLYDNTDILCADYDGDGYYNWGIGPKPMSCPICSDSIDSDDSSPLIGPYNNKYESIILCNKYKYSHTPEYITQNTYWGSSKIIDHDIYVEEGAELTIRSTVYMGDSTRIIVKPGGRLVLGYNSKLTNLCDNMWQGIEVWGDSSEDQQLHHGNYYQGYLEMKNGATIENAVCAVELWHPNHYSTTGGIIQATDAVFRNNTKSIRALNYIDHNINGSEVAYNSQFTKCNFIIDEDYLGTETFHKHVDLANVKSVYFSGCDFSVAPNAVGVSNYSMGIGAYCAGFLVESYCEEANMNPTCPDNDIVHSTFTGFYNGILSVNENNNARAFTVKDAVFSRNDCGIFAQGTGFATIVSNDFGIGKNSNCAYGIYADGVTGFCIEENSFENTPSFNNNTYGIGIFNSRGINDIYLNSYDGLTCGNLAFGVNHTADLSGRPPATILGLTYSCNDNTDNDVDFYVLKDNVSGGIASPQGSSTNPAGNTFSGSLYHIYNDGEFVINYYYNSNGTNETPSLVNDVYLHPITYSNSCNSHYGGGGVVRSAAEKAALAEAYRTADNAYSTLMNVYRSQISAGLTPSESLVAEMAKQAHDRNMAAGDIVRSCLNEEVTDVNELRLWLGNMNDISTDRMVVASYIQEGDFTNALALANTFPNVYGLHDESLSDHNDYMTLLNLYHTLYDSKRTVHELTNLETNTVKYIAENGSGNSKSMARAILMEISDRNIESLICPDMPRVPERKIADNNSDRPDNTENLVVSVAPIPATTWVAVDYKLPSGETTATMTVINPLGVKVMETEFHGVEGTKTLDLRDLTAGVYSYIVRSGEFTSTGKLVITKW